MPSYRLPEKPALEGLEAKWMPRWEEAGVYRFDRANAQHEVGHLDRVAKIDAAIGTHPGLFVTGSGFRGVGIPDCVADGRATASRAAEWLRTRRI